MRKQPRKVLRDHIRAITKSATRRLGRCGVVKRTSGFIFQGYKNVPCIVLKVILMSGRSVKIFFDFRSLRI